MNCAPTAPQNVQIPCGLRRRWPAARAASTAAAFPGHSAANSFRRGHRMRAPTPSPSWGTKNSTSAATEIRPVAASAEKSPR